MISAILLSILVPGGVYVWIEVFHDGDSHWSMGVAGVIAFNLCRPLIAILSPLNGVGQYILFAIICSLIIAVIELAFGLTFNCNYTIWDYRKVKYNFKGQLCLTFYLIWLVAMPPLIIMIDSILPKVGA